MLLRHASTLVVLLASAGSQASAPGWPTSAKWVGLPPDVAADYQLGGDHPPPAGVGVVVRDWFAGGALAGAYSICYVNAFQTQDDEDGVDRPDERSNWPPELVLDELGDDPNWDGEHLVDLGSAARRAAAVDHVRPMIEACGARGFDAVELDNLDSWTRFDGTALAGRVPFGETEAVAYAAALVDVAHDAGLAAAQKNTPQLGARRSLEVIGFDFAVVEECGAFDECAAYTEVFGDALVVIEYTDDGFADACDDVGRSVSVVRRDVELTTPADPAYVYDEC